MSESPTTDELALVARHGSGPLARSLALVQLAERRGQLDEVRNIVDDDGS